jgi:hypothetical protein
MRTTNEIGKLKKRERERSAPDIALRSFRWNQI